MSTLNVALEIPKVGPQPLFVNSFPQFIRRLAHPTKRKEEEKKFVLCGTTSNAIYCYHRALKQVASIYLSIGLSFVTFHSILYVIDYM